MNAGLAMAEANCPYCGESIDLTVDVSAGSQAYVEDCPVCCQPMNVRVSVDAEGGFRVDASRDDA